MLVPSLHKDRWFFEPGKRPGFEVSIIDQHLADRVLIAGKPSTASSRGIVRKDPFAVFGLNRSRSRLKKPVFPVMDTRREVLVEWQWALGNKVVALGELQN